MHSDTACLCSQFALRFTIAAVARVSYQGMRQEKYLAVTVQTSTEGLQFQPGAVGPVAEAPQFASDGASGPGITAAVGGSRDPGTQARLLTNQGLHSGTNQGLHSGASREFCQPCPAKAEAFQRRSIIKAPQHMQKLFSEPLVLHKQ